MVDLVWFHEDYVELFASAGVEIAAEYRPLGRRSGEGISWRSETTIAPWTIDVLRRTT